MKIQACVTKTYNGGSILQLGTFKIHHQFKFSFFVYVKNCSIEGKVNNKI
jgi:hypothetical protein